MIDKVVITKSKLDNLARAVSNKSGAALNLTIDQMVTAVNSITTGGGITPTGTIQITSNGTVNVTNYASAEVNVPTGSTINNQNKSVTPTESEQSVTADSGYTGLETVTVGAISSTYVGSGITRRTSSDLTNSLPGGAYRFIVPAGYYAEQATKEIAMYDLPTPTISINNETGVITATSYLGNSGFIDGATKTATEQLTLRDSNDLTASGATISVSAGYYSVAASKSVASGSAGAPSSISGTSASVTTSTNTLTLTKTVSVTPVVSAGYVSSGTATNSSVSLTASVTTKAAATITPTTTNQTIAAGTYLTGAQTIVGDADLVASNIISTANIFGVQGSVVVQSYYTGSSAPASSLGQNGDIYLQE